MSVWLPPVVFPFWQYSTKTTGGQNNGSSPDGLGTCTHWNRILQELPNSDRTASLARCIGGPNRSRKSSDYWDVVQSEVIPDSFGLGPFAYKNREQPIRTGLMYTGLSVIFTGSIGYAIGDIKGTGQWRYFFWITGAMTCAWSIIVGLFLPDNPVKAKFLSERQKAIAIDRVRADQTGIENKTWKRDQMIEAFTDPKTWLMVLFNLWISIPNGGLTNVSHFRGILEYH